jgi:hypothetical protein
MILRLVHNFKARNQEFRVLTPQIETEDIAEYETTHNGFDYVLVDTPGFDDTFKSNTLIVSKIKSWLSSSFRSGLRLNAIVYLHRVTDTRVSGTSSDFLQTFKRICGEQAFGNIILATTFWDEISSVELGDRRVKELLTSKGFWAKMTENGSKVVRLRPNDRQRFKLIEYIADKYGKIDLQLQTELATQDSNVLEMSKVDDKVQKFMKEMEEKTEKLRNERLEANRESEIKYQKERQQRQLEQQAQEKEMSREKGNLQAQQARIEGELRRQARRRELEHLEQRMSNISISDSHRRWY